MVGIKDEAAKEMELYTRFISSSINPRHARAARVTVLGLYVRSNLPPHIWESQNEIPTNSS